MATRLTSLRSVSMLTAASLVTLAAQFVYQLLLARYFGSSSEMDAYGAALTPPTVLGGLLTGSLGYAFLPRFIDSRQRQGAAAAWRLAASLGWLLTCVLGATALAGALAAPWLINTLYPGFSAEQIALTTRLFRWLVWLLLFNSLIGFLQSLHHAQQSFAVPALATIVGIGCTLVWTWLRASTGGMSAVVEGVVWGSIVAVAIQLPLFLRHCPPRIAWDDNVVRTLALAAPLLLGGIFKFEPQIDRYFASSMGEGTIAHLGYSKALLQAILVLATSSLSIVLFPVIANLAADRRLDDLRRELERALQFLALILLPLSAGIYLFGQPVVAELLERGRFTAADTHAVALLLVLQIGVLVGGGFGDVFGKAFYALSDTRTQLWVGAVGFGLAIALKLTWQERFGAAGLVAASSIYLLATSATMGLLLARRIGRFAGRELLWTLGRSSVATALAAAAAWPIWLHAGRLSLVWAALAGGATYLAALTLLGEPLAAELRHAAWLRRRRRELELSPDDVLAADPLGESAPPTAGDVMSDGQPLGS